MEPAIAGAILTAESLLEGAVAFAKGITHPTLPLRASFSHITSTPLPRAGHTLSVVKGRAYIFGGESSPGTLADNDMHMVILPSSGVLEADYQSISARPVEQNGSIPAPRKGHSAVVIGDSIYIFGGEGVADEKGRVWAFDTVAKAWSYLDPAPDAPHPSHRTLHAAASSELPGPKGTVFKERAPQQPADPANVVPEPPERDSWGTMFVCGGRRVEGEEMLTDGLAFDVRTRSWSNIPTPPGPPRVGASMAVVGSRLYRFGGHSGESYIGGRVEWLDVGSVWQHAESGTTALQSGWVWEEIAYQEGEGPQPRSGAGLVGVTTGQGRKYLLAIGGEGKAPLSLEVSGKDVAADESSTCFDDIWAFQLPPESMTGASVKDAARHAIKMDVKQAKWAEVQYHYLDASGEEEKEIPGEPRMKGMGLRKAFAAAKGTEVDGASVVVWGGVDEKGQVLNDGWLITVDR